MSTLLFTGGLDSAIAAALNDYSCLLYYELGHKYQKNELKAAIKIADYLNNFIKKENKKQPFWWEGSLKLGEYEKSNGFIPLRNLFIFAHATLHDSEIHLIKTRGEASADKSEKFRRETEKLINYCLQDSGWLPGGRKIKLIYPFSHLTKTQLLAKFLEEIGDTTYLELTRSCYSRDLYHCGSCGGCISRAVAEINNDIKFTIYNTNPFISLMQNKIHFTWREFFTTIPNNIEKIKAIQKFRKGNW